MSLLVAIYQDLSMQKQKNKELKLAVVLLVLKKNLGENLKEDLKVDVDKNRCGQSGQRFEKTGAKT